MANININEISQNYTYNIGNSSYACVALPIMSSWGPGYQYDTSSIIDLDAEKIENSVWNRFPATQEGLESFVSTYRGPATHYLGRKDFSYQQAMTLLTAGYDLLICRVAGGNQAVGQIKFKDYAPFTIRAKYSGTFGNNLDVNVRKIERRSSAYWNVVVYIVDATTSARTAVENINFVFDLEKSNDTILHISEIESSFLEFDVANAPTYDDIELEDSFAEDDPDYVWDSQYKIQVVSLKNGTDHPEIDNAEELARLEQQLQDKLAEVHEAHADLENAHDVVESTHAEQQEAHSAYTEASEDANTKHDIMNASKEVMDKWKALFDLRKALDTKESAKDSAQTSRDEIINNPDSTDEQKQEAEAAYQAALDEYNAANEAYQAKLVEFEEQDRTKAEFQALYTQWKSDYAEKKSAYTEAKNVKEELEAEYASKTDAYIAAKETYDSAKEHYLELKSEYGAIKSLIGSKEITDYVECALQCAKNRYAYSIFGKNYADLTDDSVVVDGVNYIKILEEKDPTTHTSTDITPVSDRNQAIIICRREWMFNAAYCVLDALDDRLAYNPNRVIVPGWDDQDMLFLEPTLFSMSKEPKARDLKINTVSPLHQKLMDVAYYSRCATAYIDIPRSVEKWEVYNEAEDVTSSTTDDEQAGYAQRLARLNETMNLATVNGAFYSSHSALFAPWGKYMYVGTRKQLQASPSFLALMIDRAMIKNQTSQYEWQLPNNRRNNLRIGKLDYNISKKYLDLWQSLEGVGVNCITRIPDIGLSIWGNSTLYEVPPATYQALANLSTRKLVNAVEDLAYRCGISITFNYNNDQAYNSFYAGMTPLLDTMRNVGAITDYYLRMSEDVNGLDQVNANSVIGKIYLVIDGVINDINIDLIALPPQTSLDEYRA